MASLSPSTTTTTTNTTTAISAAPINPLFLKASRLSAYRNKTSRVAPKISCNAAKNDRGPQKPNEHVVDRRNMLIGLGGLYGAAATFGVAPATFAKPTAPEVTKCNPNADDVPANVKGLNCCPPMAANIVDFRLPNNNRVTRIRPAAHNMDDKYLEKFTKAIALMRALPDSDPRSFTQQANVHCAYCNGAYHQEGFPKIDLQVHGSWLFFPFHRAYLYFFEKILGKLIDDPTFALPYWNWDHPDGMKLPAMYADPKSPLYDPIREPNHTPIATLDLSYDGNDNPNVSKADLIATNLTVMYRQMVSNAKNPGLFMGQPYRAGDTGSQPGSVEQMPHGTIHNWVGKKNTPNWEDMGNFYSAARDPIFYAHHANVDRMWSVWRTLGPKNKDFKENDFLDSSFIFYDENAQAIRIKVRDCLDMKKLRYDYQPMDLPWLKSRPTPRRARVKAAFSKIKEAVAATNVDVPTVVFPKPLDHIIRTHLVRPQKSRTKKAKDNEEEVLVIQVESLASAYSKFDVYVNDEDERPTRENRAKTEYAGSFVNVPHKHRGGKDHKMTTTLRLGLTDLIEDLGADDDEGIDVIFVPRAGTESVIIKNVKIELD